MGGVAADGRAGTCSAFAHPSRSAARRSTWSAWGSPWRRSRAATSARPTASNSRGWPGRSWARTGARRSRPAGCPRPLAASTIVALALTEPGVGSDAANLACRAERDGDGYVITGEKSGISLGMVAQAAIVFARTDADAKARGVTAFLVPLDLTRRRPEPAARPRHSRRRSAPCCPSITSGVPASHRVGAEGTGFYQVMQGFDYNRVLIALRLPRSGPGLARGDDGLRQGAQGLRARRSRRSRACPSRSPRRPPISTPPGGSAIGRCGSPIAVCLTPRNRRW